MSNLFIPKNLVVNLPRIQLCDNVFDIGLIANGGCISIMCNNCILSESHVTELEKFANGITLSSQQDFFNE